MYSAGKDLAESVKETERPCEIASRHFNTRVEIEVEVENEDARVIGEGEG